VESERLGDPPDLEIVALGGLGEFGMNLMVYRQGEDCLIVDAGMMFPGEDHLGIDVVVPDLSWLDACGRIHGVVLTHGHEDHIGALPYLLSRHDVPVHATPYTLGLIRNRLAEHELLSGRDLRRLPDDAPVSIGPFSVRAYVAAHSIPQSRILGIDTASGMVVHTADFKVDPDPVDGAATDLDALERLGRNGVLILLSDSTNADRPGSTPGERSVFDGLDAAMAGRRGRVIVTTFSSHVARLLQLARLAERHGRRIAFVGSSLLAHVDVATRLGLLPLAEGLRMMPEDIPRADPATVLVVAAGSQGEPMSAMSRIAVGQHRLVPVEPGDLAIHSAREIPGNQKSISRMVNHLLRRGADVITAADAPVHVSGHASRDELCRVLQLLRPRYFVPIHGEYRQLVAHARLARECGVPPERVLLAESGDVIAVRRDAIAVRDRVHVGQVFIDRTADEIDLETLRDRRRLAGDGIVVPVVAVHRESGAVNGYPEIMARGFVSGSDGDGDFLEDARRVVADCLAEATPEERADERLLRARIQSELKRFVRRRTQRQPLIIPIIVEL
jgi:ribonuclease J